MCLILTSSWLIVCRGGWTLEAIKGQRKSRVYKDILSGLSDADKDSDDEACVDTASDNGTVGENLSSGEEGPTCAANEQSSSAVSLVHPGETLSVTNVTMTTPPVIAALNFLRFYRFFLIPLLRARGSRCLSIRRRCINCSVPA